MARASAGFATESAWFASPNSAKSSLMRRPSCRNRSFSTGSLSRQAKVQHFDSGSDRGAFIEALLVMVAVEVPIVVVPVRSVVVADLATIAFPVA